MEKAFKCLAKERNGRHAAGHALYVTASPFNDQHAYMPWLKKHAIVLKKFKAATGKELTLWFIDSLNYNPNEEKEEKKEDVPSEPRRDALGRFRQRGGRILARKV